jgi:hypothetical protein
VSPSPSAVRSQPNNLVFITLHSCRRTTFFVVRALGGRSYADTSLIPHFVRDLRLGVSTQDDNVDIDGGGGKKKEERRKTKDRNKSKSRSKSRSKSKGRMVFLELP